MRYYPNLNNYNIFGSGASNGLLKTDIYEKDGMYVLKMEAPGFQKENMQIELSEGYLKVTATKQSHTEEKGRMVRRERYVGTASRSFYIGDGYKQEDIKAKFENGELLITLPAQVEKAEEDTKTISIA